MKNYLYLILIFIGPLLCAQNINIPNYNFVNNLNGWTISGNSISMTNSNASFAGGILAIENASQNIETYVLQSSPFPLFANDNYVFFTSYGYYAFDPNMGVMQLGMLSSVVLKNSAGNVVHTFNLSCSPYFGPGQMDFCESNPFLIDTTDNYYLELTGDLEPLDSNNYEVTYNFGEINFYKDNSPHSIFGKVSFDSNADNCQTSNNTLANIQVKNTAVNTGNVYFSYTNTLGNYGFTFDEIGDVITQVSNAAIVSNPPNYTNVFTTAQTISNQDFCITSASAGTDVGVIIVPTTAARPGFNSGYSIVYTNNGAINASGVIDFSFNDSFVNYVSSSPIENTSTVNSLSWSYLDLLPFETRVIHIDFNLNTPPTVNNGDVLIFDAAISPNGETNASNNTFNLQQVTIGSYDPNDALVLQGTFISPSQVSDNLYFRIRFQNTGTASAININVNTVLDSDLDWNTFVPVYSSHNYTVNLNANAVNFKFDNINLADNTLDEPNSHGFIIFKAKPVTGFAVGDLIECLANIYFDYNLPITTNTATTQIDTTLSLNDNLDLSSNLNIYPNPVMDSLIVILKTKSEYRLIAVNGQELLVGHFNKGENSLDLTSLSTGLYFLSFKTSKGISVKKIIKE